MNWPKSYKFACPRCKRVFAKSISRVVLGSGSRICRGCRAVFPDGTIEWRAASRRQKLEFLFPEKARFYLAGCVVMGIAGTVLTASHWEDEVGVAIFSVSVALVPLLIRFVWCGVQIRKSAKRSDVAWLAKAGYQPQETSGSWQK